MMRKGIVVFVLLAALGAAPVAAKAAPNPAFVYHFKGRLGAAILTDCPNPATVGTTCRAVDVTAFEQRINVKGDKTDSGPVVNVILYAVTITGPGTFDAVAIGNGFTSAATVTINGSLSKGEASAASVPLCDFGCDPSSPTSISINVQWSGFGPTQSFKDHQLFKDPICKFNVHNSGSFREADATGTVDGVTFVEPALPGFQATLQSDASGFVERCTV
jgi:hypothetical protein